MLKCLVLLTVLATARACAPGGGNQPATITLFTDENYNSSQHAYYKSVATNLVTISLMFPQSL
ncbi:hypothetical protein ANCCAN_30170 [Ancylostoma caninum]|uniref:Uncharacterized protein n=1 Tax=Ancylostoma caninum TaxID=29170 RepID=A0A368EZI4_ANCCA|nr:hypothetical protein ANCCAN_30170 [Ancylostoma caninum]